LDLPEYAANIEISGQFALILGDFGNIRVKMPENTTNIIYQGKLL